MKSPYLFDSHALLTFFQNEKGAEVVARLLQRAIKQDTQRLICVINVGEILYITKRHFGDPKKIEVFGRIHQMGFKILQVPENLVFKAAELKAEYPISYADCFALACAIDHSAVLVTGDPEFQEVSHLVEIKWT